LPPPVKGSQMAEFTSVSQWDNGTAPPTNPVRSPSRWLPYTFDVEDEAILEGQAKWQQVMSSQPGRKSWTISNLGPNDCQLSNVPLPGGTQGISVAAGGVWSEEVEDEVWVWCEGGTVLNVSLTYTPLYDAVGGASTPGGEIPYVGNLLP
jgi:hypothetical protein